MPWIWVSHRCAEGFPLAWYALSTHPDHGARDAEAGEQGRREVVVVAVAHHARIPAHQWINPW